MQNEADIVALIVISSLIFLALSICIIVFVLVYQRKRLEYKKEKQTLKATYEQEILRSQVEIQNQTLKYVGEELHDNIQQMLLVVKLYLSMLERDLHTP